MNLIDQDKLAKDISIFQLREKLDMHIAFQSDNTILERLCKKYRNINI